MPGSVTATKSDAKNASVFWLTYAEEHHSIASRIERVKKIRRERSMRRKKERRKHNGRNFDLRETLFGSVGSESKLNDFFCSHLLLRFCENFVKKPHWLFSLSLSLVLTLWHAHMHSHIQTHRCTHQHTQTRPHSHSFTHIVHLTVTHAQTHSSTDEHPYSTHTRTRTPDLPLPTFPLSIVRIHERPLGWKFKPRVYLDSPQKKKESCEVLFLAPLK